MPRRHIPLPHHPCLVWRDRCSRRWPAGRRSSYPTSLRFTTRRTRGARCPRVWRRGGWAGAVNGLLDDAHGERRWQGRGGPCERYAWPVVGATGARRVRRVSHDGFDLLFGPSVERAPRDRGRRLYLTFDDALTSMRHRDSRDARRRAVSAGFFMVGSMCACSQAGAPGCGTRAMRSGNSYRSTTSSSICAAAAHSRRAAQAHVAIVVRTGREPRSFRAPHGLRSPFLAPLARRFGYTVFGWTFGVFDTARPVRGDPAPRAVRLRPGAIGVAARWRRLRFERDRMQTAEALPGITRTRARGVRVRALSELIPDRSTLTLTGHSGHLGFLATQTRAPSSMIALIDLHAASRPWAQCLSERPNVLLLLPFKNTLSNHSFHIRIDRGTAFHTRSTQSARRVSPHARSFDELLGVI